MPGDRFRYTAKAITLSIASFIATSLELLDANRYLEALTLTCAAVDATASRTHASVPTNNQRYKAFLESKMRIVTHFGFPGIEASSLRIGCKNLPNIKTDGKGMAGIQDSLYHVVRCGLIHQCVTDEKLKFVPNTQIGDDGTLFVLPKSIIAGLIFAVVATPENSDQNKESPDTISVAGSEIPLGSLWGTGEQILDRGITM